MQSRKWAGAASVLLIAAGLGISLYLFARGNQLTQGPAVSDFCNAVFDTSCDATLTSEYGHALGLSVAGWGVVYFAALAALVLGGIALRSVLLRAALAGALLLNLAGLVVSGYLAWLIVSGKVPVCPLCLVTHATNVLLFGALLLYRGESPTGFLKDTGAGLAYIFAPGQQSSPEQTTRLVAFVAAGLFVVATYQGLALRDQPPPAAPVLSPVAATPEAASTSRNNAEQAVRNIIQSYMDQDVIEIPVEADDPRLGPANAPAQLVVFSDFECPSCKAKSKLLLRLAETYGDRISIVEKNYPISSACNSAIVSNPHKFACNAAYAAVAAQMQGKYWPYHDLIYRLKNAPTLDALIQTARVAGLDLAKFSADMDSDAAKAKVKRDIDLGIKLKVIQTPTIYLNGRLLTAETSPQLPLLLNTIFESAAKGNEPARE